MTLANPRPAGDIEQAEYENEAEAKRVLMIGKTTSSDYVIIKVENDGSLG